MGLLSCTLCLSTIITIQTVGDLHLVNLQFKSLTCKHVLIIIYGWGEWKVECASIFYRLSLAIKHLETINFLWLQQFKAL